MHEIDQTKLSDQTKFRLYEIKKNFFNEINQQKTYSKKLNRYVTIFDYIDIVNSKRKLCFNLFFNNLNH